MSIAYNLLRPADAQLTSYEVEDNSSWRCQITTINGVTTSGYELVITKLDTSIVAILSNATEVRQDYCNPDVKPETPHLEAEEILAEIGFKLPVKSEVGVS